MGRLTNISGKEILGRSLQRVKKCQKINKLLFVQG